MTYMIKRRYYLIFGFFLFIIVSIILIEVFFGPQKNAATPSPIFPTPTLFPLQSTQTKNAGVYAIDGKKMSDKIDSRQPLSPSEQTLRKQLIDDALKNQQVAQSNSLYTMYYSKSFDMFQVEILSTDIQTTKQQTTQWFIDKGFSQNGVCNLPVMFIISSSIKQQLIDKNVSFSYLPEGC